MSISQKFAAGVAAVALTAGLVNANAQQVRIVPSGSSATSNTTTATAPREICKQEAGKDADAFLTFFPTAAKAMGSKDNVGCEFVIAPGKKLTLTKTYDLSVKAEENAFGNLMSRLATGETQAAQADLERARAEAERKRQEGPLNEAARRAAEAGNVANQVGGAVQAACGLAGLLGKPCNR